MPYYDQAQTACAAGSYDEAVELQNQALSYGEYWNFLFGRAKALRCSHRYQEALLDLDRAIALRPSKTDLYIERAICYGLLRNTAAARRDMDLARVFPGEEGVRERIERWLRGISPRSRI